MQDDHRVRMPLQDGRAPCCSAASSRIELPHEQVRRRRHLAEPRADDRRSLGAARSRGSRRYSAAVTNGWSASANIAASLSPARCSTPVRNELPMPVAKSGFRAWRTGSPSRRRNDACARCPDTTSDLVEPGCRTADAPSAGRSARRPAAAAASARPSAWTPRLPAGRRSPFRSLNAGCSRTRCRSAAVAGAEVLSCSPRAPPRSPWRAGPGFIPPGGMPRDTRSL